MRRTLAAALLLAAAPAASTTFVETTVEEAARASEAVVRGRVLTTESRVTVEGRIVTDVEISVADAWKGAPGATVQVVVPGGQAGALALKVDAAPTFEPGEEVVVFLVRRGNAWRVSGHALGKYRVVGDEARPSLDGAKIVPRSLPAGERAVGPMRVEELARRVRATR
jgi:hypothetical protein